MKKSSVSEWYKLFKEGRDNVEDFDITNEQCSVSSLESMVLFTLNSFLKAKQSARLIMWKYWNGYMNLCVGKGLYLGPNVGFSTMTIPQLTKVLSSSFWPKYPLLKWNTYPIPWFGSEWLLAISKNKICLKWTKISGYWKHQNNMTTAQKAIPQQKYQKCFQQWQAASLE